MITLKSTNAESLTILNAWSIRDHLGKFINIHLVDGDDDEVYLECAINDLQAIALRDALDKWLSEDSEVAPLNVYGEEI